ncbi:MAG: DNA mismatch repair endonuclease MutL [Candidatus Faecimonas sp.]|nr:DNA mismatch repair endonuclease MutL [Mycoplasmatota bacterium]MDY2908785.1 DNA mismatch repair endonuclease MutL [Candidatus Faecimonas sp.]
MSKIKVMDEILANKIAAGEVVEKTMNVVKELVENAIDAESDEIKIELIDSGVKEVKVTDNGIGMDRDDATLAFSRHATSKLKNLDDLFNIESLGFRGEALPSIASVSNIELKTSNGKIGTYLTLSGGKNMHVEESDLQQGTTITVKDLFYNTPVRLKYLKNLYVELANITEYINKMALSYPNIKFTLINNDKVLLDTDGKGDLRKVIYQIYGADITKKMIEVTGENDDYYIHGYISYPEMTKSNRSAITTLVNGRVIKNNELNKIITDAYHTYIPKDKFPIIVLNIDVDPILIDINIHPTKMDIKFSKMDTLKDIVFDIVSKELKRLTLIPTISTRTEEALRETTIPLYNAYKKEVPTPKQTYEETVLDFSISEENTTTETTKPEETEALAQEKITPRIKHMIPRGIVYSTYIIAENEDGMYIIDQHAAAERINYEKVLKSLKEKVIPIDLLIPIKIELASNEFLIVKNHLDILKEYGFEAEEFGMNTIIIRSHPNWIFDDIAEECIRKVVDIIISKESFDFDQFVWRMAATMACRMSVKANDYLSYDDQVWLLETLRNCENPFTCPHGRPTIITYTKYDLEKLFKRSLD